MAFACASARQSRTPCMDTRPHLGTTDVTKPTNSYAGFRRNRCKAQAESFPVLQEMTNFCLLITYNGPLANSGKTSGRGTPVMISMAGQQVFAAHCARQWNSVPHSGQRLFSAGRLMEREEPHAKGAADAKGILAGSALRPSRPSREEFGSERRRDAELEVHARRVSRQVPPPCRGSATASCL